MNDDDYLFDFIEAGECPECEGALDEDDAGHLCTECGWTDGPDDDDDYASLDMDTD